MDIKQIERSEIWVLARPNTPKYGCWPDQNIGMKQTEQTEKWVKTRPNRQKNGYESYQAVNQIKI